MAYTLCVSVHSEEVLLTGRVVKVTDGDTITVLVPSGGMHSNALIMQHKIRLHGIDAPEQGQSFGKASGQFLAGLVAGRDVKVKWSKKDRYGRILGTVFLDNREINLEMLQAGFAWHYKKYDSTPAYAKAEAEARVARKGLWRDEKPVDPQTFRKAIKSKKGSGKDGKKVFTGS